MSNPCTEKTNPYKQLTLFEDTEHANEVNELYKATYNYLYGKPVNSQEYATEVHRKVCDKLNDLYNRKNTDYGNSFHKTYIEEGLAMCRIRLSDKLERFKQLSKGNTQLINDESIQDTLLDLANYAIMTYMEIECFGKIQGEKTDGE
ncbi:MAG: DUF1599 domain-containing protein [Methanobrevibacter sp.]|nr:DUF1599 domain-containing protein [Methanobrevibacter sp.]